MVFKIITLLFFNLLGVIGDKIPKFVLFGETVNICASVNSACTGGEIWISGITRALLGDDREFKVQGLEVKGKGFGSVFKLLE